MKKVKPLKIAIVSGEIPAPTFIERLLAGLVKNNVELLLFGKVHGRIENRKKVRIVGLVKRYESLSSKWNLLKYKFLVALLKRKDYNKLRELNHNTDYESYAILWYSPVLIHVQWSKSLEQYIWVQKFNIKLVVSLRGAHINYSPIANANLANKYRLFFPLVNAFHGVSHAICAEAIQYGADKSKCHVVYSGFDLKKFPKPINLNYIDSSQPLKIISVGRAHWKKGYHYALDAIKMLKSMEVNVRYDIIGTGKEEELTFQKADLGLENEVTFRSKLPFHQVIDAVRAADVFLLPSVEEGIANVVIEAMLSGTPVITTSCGGMKELVTDGISGFLVPIRNPKAIASAIIKFSKLSLEQINGMRSAAYDKAAAQHNEDQMVNGMMQLYKNALNS